MKNFDELIAKLNKAKRNKEPVLLETNASGMSESYLIYLDYIGKRWARGHRIIIDESGDISIPETINYSSVIEKDNRLFNSKLIFMEDNPYD